MIQTWFSLQTAYYLFQGHLLKKIFYLLSKLIDFKLRVFKSYLLLFIKLSFSNLPIYKSFKIFYNICTYSLATWITTKPLWRLHCISQSTGAHGPVSVWATYTHCFGGSNPLSASKSSYPQNINLFDMHSKPIQTCVFIVLKQLAFNRLLLLSHNIPTYLNVYFNLKLLYILTNTFTLLQRKGTLGKMKSTSSWKFYLDSTFPTTQDANYWFWIDLMLKTGQH